MNVSINTLLAFVTIVGDNINFVPLFFDTFVRFLTRVTHIVPLLFFRDNILTTLYAITELGRRFIDFNVGDYTRYRYTERRGDRRTSSFTRDSFRGSFPM